jgi:hypothetical protein
MFDQPIITVREFRDVLKGFVQVGHESVVRAYKFIDLVSEDRMSADDAWRIAGLLKDGPLGEDEAGGAPEKPFRFRGIPGRLMD